MGLYTKPKAVKSKSTGIKPFLEKPKVSFPDMMQRVTQTSRDWVTKEKHSEMIKPYLADPDLSYPGMDDLWPTPYPNEFPPMDAGDWTNVDTGAPVTKLGCAISCRQIRGCDNPVRCYYMRVPADEKSRVDGWMVIPHITYSGAALLAWKSTYQWPIEVGDIEWHPEAGLFGEIWINPPAGDWSNLYTETSPITDTFLVLKIQFTQEDGSKCTDIVTVICDQCEDAVAISFDDASTADTIAPGGSITVYVKDGFPPYYWSVGGAAGYSFATSATDVPQNTLSCANGSCGVEYDPKVTVTITDNCDTQCNGTIRSTGGQWSDAVESCGCTCTGTDETCSDVTNCPGGLAEYIVGEERWLAGYEGNQCYVGGDCTMDCVHTPPCTCKNCLPACVCNAAGYCKVGSISYYVWEC